MLGDQVSRSLKDLNVLVTGGATRVGRAISLALASEGCNIALHYFSNRIQATEVSSSIKELGVKCVALEGDFRKIDQVKKVADSAVESFGVIDILINNASIYPDNDKISSVHSLRKESFEDWQDAIAINTTAPFFLIQNLLTSLESSRWGNVINIVDQSVSNPFVERAAHSISKAGLAAVTKLAAKSLNPGVRVNALELGAILPGANMSPEDLKSRKWGGVESVVNAILFVLRNQFINGEIICVRGNEHLKFGV